MCKEKVKYSGAQWLYTHTWSCDYHDEVSEVRKCKFKNNSLQIYEFEPGKNDSKCSEELVQNFGKFAQKRTKEKESNRAKIVCHRKIQTQ